MAHIDNTYVEQAIGTSTWDDLCDSTAAVKTQLLDAATALVDSTLRKRGYTPPGTAGNLVKMATLGALLPQAYGRKGLKVPEQFALHMNVMERLHDGTLIPDTLTPDTSKAVGGFKFSDSTSDGKPKIFGTLRDDF